MQDRLFEAQTFPQPFPLSQFQRPVVLAPHPDDEVFGCGGLLALWAQQGVRAQVVVLTGGQAQGDGVQRQAESQAAAEHLGHYGLDFWQLPDRELRCTPMFIERIAAYLEAHQADILLVPALHEPHPDHQACALAALWSLGQLSRVIDLGFYESGTALVHCSHLVDISSVQEQKLRAMQAFSSQEDVQPYSSRIAALNHYRALTLGSHVQAAEGLQWLPLPQLGWAGLLPALDPLFLHARGQAVHPEDLPLVSIVMRTQGGTVLEAAVASICAQSYAQWELIIAPTQPGLSPPAWLERPSAKILWHSSDAPADTVTATNAALVQANGSYVLVMDDSNFLPPSHVAELVQLLRQNPGLYAACLQPQRAHPGAAPAIHEVLFARSLVAQGVCRWRHAAAHTPDADFLLQVQLQTCLAQPPSTVASASTKAMTSDLAEEDWQQRWAQSQQALAQAQADLHDIHISRAWRWVQKLRRIRQFFRITKGKV